MSDQARPFDRILEIIAKRSLSESKACEQAGLTRSALAAARRRSGNIDLESIKAFAKSLNVPLSELLGEPSATEAPLDATLQQASARTLAPHNALHPSPLNPRKRFDPDAVVDLSHSVEKEGVLMQLLVRYANQPGNSPIAGAAETEFEIIAGERRWRASGLVIERGAWPADHLLPIRLIDPCDDRKMRELALTENVARKDMTPWEEAEAFAGLEEDGATPAEIGNIVGMTARTVQKRLRLVKDLTPKVRAALAAGELQVEFANVLAAYCPKSKQDATLEELKRGQHGTSANLKQNCLRSTRPTSVAFFDLKLYKGQLIEDDDKSGLQYFVDTEQFERLQLAAVDAKVEELHKTYGWVEVADYRASKYFHEWDYIKNATGPDAGAVIELEYDRSVKVHLGLAKKKAPATSVGGKGTQPDPEPVTKSHCVHAHQRKTVAMQNAVAAAPMMAMRLVCSALLGSTEAVRIESSEIREEIISGTVKDIIAKLADPLSTLKGSKGLRFRGDGVRVFEYNQHGNDHAGVWNHLADMPDEDVARLFAALVALRTGTFDDWNPSVGDAPASMAVAASLNIVGAEARHGLGLRKEDLEGARKDTLIAYTKLEGIPGNTAAKKTKDIVDLICDLSDPMNVFPTLRFGTTAEIKTLLKGNPLRRSATQPSDRPQMAFSEISPAAIESLMAIKTAPPGGISGNELMLSTGVSYDALLEMVNDQILYADTDNFLIPGPRFPSPTLLASLAASRPIAAPPTPQDPYADFLDYARTIAADLPDTEEGVMEALQKGINALTVRPDDEPLGLHIRFDEIVFPETTDETTAQVVIDELFEIYAPSEEYAGIEVIGDAVGFVCEKLGIVPAFIRRAPAAE